MGIEEEQPELPFVLSPFEQDANKKIIDLLMVFFKNDIVKVDKWLKTANPHFGEVAPLAMIACGRGEKVLKFILATKDEGGW